MWKLKSFVECRTVGDLMKVLVEYDPDTGVDYQDVDQYGEGVDPGYGVEVQHYSNEEGKVRLELRFPGD